MAKSSEDLPNASLDELKARAGDYHLKAVRLKELEREATANRGLLEALLTRAKETAAQLNMQMPDSRILSQATVPLSPNFPAKGTDDRPWLLCGSRGAWCVPGAGAWHAERRLRNAGELQTAFGLKPLATIPLVETASSKAPLRLDTAALKSAKLARLLPESAAAETRHIANLLLREPNSLFAESIQSLRLALRHVGVGRDVKVLQLTSALPGEGKSTIAANLARAAALCGDRVLLIDADLRRPSIGSSLGLPASPGLAELLAGSSSVSDFIMRDSYSGLDFLAGDLRRRRRGAQPSVVARADQPHRKSACRL